MRAPALRLAPRHSAGQRKLPWTSGRTRGLWGCRLQAAAVGVIGLRQEVRRGAAGAGGLARCRPPARTARKQTGHAPQEPLRPLPNLASSMSGNTGTEW